MRKLSPYTVTHVAPFLTWMILMSLLDANAVGYFIRTCVTAIIGLYCIAANRRIRRVRPLAMPPISGSPARTLVWGITAGLLVAALWILPESSELYRTWCCWPIGSVPTPDSNPAPYNPAVCGWFYTIAKLMGSAFVIAPVEEVFFRSFLYRRLQAVDFTAVSQTQFRWEPFLWTIFLFALEHDRFVAASMAGAVYGLLAIRVGLPTAIVAHIVTNLVLGLHVIGAGAWGFW